MPIDELQGDFDSAISRHSQFIIHAPTGTGKSTRVPFWLLAWLGRTASRQKLYLIQPRRLAAAAIARQLATLLGETVGQTVGLRTRFDRVVSAITQIEVITEGMFVRFVQDNPGLDGVAGVIFDEFHERSIQLDMGLAFAIDCQQAYRTLDNPLKLIVMSATLAAEQLRLKLDNPCMLRSEGKIFPVETIYRPKPNNHGSVERHVAAVIAEFVERDDKSALVFLPGMKEIRGVQRLLERNNWGASIVVAPLHASLSSTEQQLAISASREGIRKIVLSTNVAETSLTIEGITTVIDSGLAKVPYFDQNKSISQLRTQMISQASSDQRKGRAGRLSPGKCYRLWSKELHHRLQQYEVPQILSDDLTPAVLEANLWGESNLCNLTLLDYPGDSSVAAARDLLAGLGAVGQNGQLSRRGVLMAKLGVAPRLAAMCLEGQKTQDTALASSLAVVLSEGSIRSAERESDIMLSLRAMSDPFNKHGFDERSVHRLVKLSKQLCRRLDSSRPFQLTAIEKSEQLLLHAFPDRIAKKRGDKGGRYLIATGQEVQLHESDNLYSQPWLLVLDYGSQSSGAYIHLAAAVSDSCIKDYTTEFAKTIVETFWDEGKGAVVAVERLMLGAIIVREQQVTPELTRVVEVLLEYVKRCQLSCLDINGFSQWRSRVMWLNKHSDLEIESPSISELAASASDWLAPYLAGVRSLADLRKISLLPVVLNRLEWGVRQRIDQLAPLSITLPTGTKRKIDYRAGGATVLSVKIQELYGLTDTPAINEGHNKLVLEMLSPASRPLQLTDDLKGFWRNTYPDLCKEMKGRYPKHYWPEQPESARATNRTKKNMG